MPSIRKPWPVSRRDTDSVALNTMEDKTPEATATDVDKSAGAAGAKKDLKTFSNLHRYHNSAILIDAGI